MTEVYIQAIGAVCALGVGKQEIISNLISGMSVGSENYEKTLYSGRQAYVSIAKSQLNLLNENLSDADNRNNRLSATAYSQISSTIEQVKLEVPSHRIGVVMGTSTTAISEGENAIKQYTKTGKLPDNFRFEHQDIGDTANFVARLSGATGPCYSISTACSSSNRAFISAAELITAGLCDVIICGGTDSLCELTMNGFDSLEQISSIPCRPFDEHRQGINIGEASSLFVLTSQNAPLFLAGWGESGEGHHMSAPLPSGLGAYQAMEAALSRANLTAGDIGYINAHGTATILNDSMESKAILHVFGSKVPVSSTKALTGHCLGAAGAIEAAICCWLLEEDLYARQWPIDFSAAKNVESLNYANNTGQLEKPWVLSNNFAFGGNNASLIFGKQDI